MRLPPSRPVLIRSLHLFALWALGVAYPVFQVLFNADMLRQNQMSRPDVLLLSLVIAFIGPLFLTALLLVASLVHRKCGDALYALCITLLFSANILLLLKSMPFIELPLQAFLSVICGIGLTVLLFRKETFRQFLAWLASNAILLPLLYVLTAPITPPYNETPQPRLAAPAISHPVPIVFIVLDELPLSTLLDAHDQIDAIRYPHFAALAQNATWYKNATTVNAFTVGALPALVTGLRTPVKTNPQTRQPQCNTPPANTSYHPNSLFTLLQKNYRFHVSESVVMLCPDDVCPQQGAAQPPDESFFGNLQAGADLLMTFLNSYLFNILFNSPRFDAFADNLNYRFLSDEKKLVPPQLHRGDIANYKWFMETLAQNPEKPTLYFWHPTLPHDPWEFTPTGRNYGAWPLTERVTLHCEDFPKKPLCQNTRRNHSMQQRHLLQTAYADHMLGEILKQLKTSGLYNKALVIVVGDHGISFRPGAPHRAATPQNVGDILNVPMFIKLPGQTRGEVSLTPAETIDLLPTIATVLKTPLPWKTDGQSLLASKTAVTPSVCTEEEFISTDMATIEKQRIESTRDKIRQFGSGSERPDDLYNLGPHAKLVGSVAPKPSESLNVRLVVDRPDTQLLNSVSTDRLDGLLYVSGRAEFPANLHPDDYALAIVMHGRIRTVTRFFQTLDDKRHYFMALLPESAYKAGANPLTFVLVHNGDRNKVYKPEI